MIKKIVSSIGLWCALSGMVIAQERYASSQHDFTLITITQGLEYPWGLDFLPNGAMLVTESKRPALRLVTKDGTLDSRPITGLPSNISTAGQGGLLDVAVHPNFTQNQWIYLSYAGQGQGGVGTEVVRGRLNLGQYHLEEVKLLFSAAPKTAGAAHYGSRLVFAADGTLFITVGERYHYLHEAQNPTNHLGSVIRLHDDGTIPPDNPFVAQPEYRPEIYSYGHRNPQGLALRNDGVMWLHEHGPRGGDEVNILDTAGANYGWPRITYGIDYSGAIISDQTHHTGMEQPIVYWVPSIAPSGMMFYTGDQFPRWKGNIFIGALRGTHIRRLVLQGNRVVTQEVLLPDYARIRDVINGPEGYVYFITDESDGKILHLQP